MHRDNHDELKEMNRQIDMIGKPIMFIAFFMLLILVAVNVGRMI